MDNIIEINAVVRREMLDRVIHRLKHCGVNRMIIGKIHAVGSGVDPSTMKLSFDEGSQYSDKSRITFACDADEADSLMDAIVDAARTGRKGDGFVQSSPITEIRHIRTGRAGKAALEKN